MKPIEQIHSEASENFEAERKAFALRQGRERAFLNAAIAFGYFVLCAFCAAGFTNEFLVAVAVSGAVTGFAGVGYNLHWAARYIRALRVFNERIRR